MALAGPVGEEIRGDLQDDSRVQCVHHVVVEDVAEIEAGEGEDPPRRRYWVSVRAVTRFERNNLEWKNERSSQQEMLLLA